MLLFRPQSLVVIHSETSGDATEKKNILNKIKSFFSKKKKAETEDETNSSEESKETTTDENAEQKETETKKTK